MTSPRILAVNDVQLCVETFGDPTHPAVLLIAGAGAPMDWWEADFCARLAAATRYVIRYDNRDTGESTSYPVGQPGYAADDLVADSMGVLDSLEVARAHVVGISMGGAIAQLAALEYPDRVLSLTLISSTPGPGADDLPPPIERLRRQFAQSPAVDWSNPATGVEALVAMMRGVASTSRPFNEAAIRSIAGRVVERTTNLAASMTNQHLIDGTDPWRERLAQIAVPTLVITARKIRCFRTSTPKRSAARYQ